MVEFCPESGLCVRDNYFKHSCFHKYTRIPRVHDGVEVKNMIDLEVVKKDILHYVQDVRAMIGMGRGLSDHPVVWCKVRLVKEWRWWLELEGSDARN